MPIEAKDLSFTKHKFLCRVIGPDNDSFSASLLAWLNENRTRAVVIVLNGEFWGQVWEVEEKTLNHWPIMTKLLCRPLPNAEGSELNESLWE